MRRGIAWAALGTALAATLVGCLQADSPAPRAPHPDGWSEAALPDGDGHDHADPAHHEGRSTRNFEVLGFTPFTSGHYGGRPAGGSLCGDAQAVPGERRLAAVESRSDVAFTLVDVTRADDPRVLGELVMETTYVYDLAVVLDGRHVVLATAGTDNIPPRLPSQAPGPAMTWRGPCQAGGPSGMPVRDPTGALAALPWPMHLILVDISDPAAPTIVDALPLAGHGHSVFPYRQDGRDLLLVSTFGQAPAGPLSGYYFYEVAATAAGAALQPLGHHIPPGDGPAGVGGPRAHDAWVALHPVTGRMVAYLTGADRLTVLDATDPESPVVLGTWQEPVADSFLHGAYPLAELRGGRHYTVVGPEYCAIPEHTPTGIAWVLDTTDPGAPAPVGAWTLPHEVSWDGCYMFSNHYFTVVGDTLLMSMYHGGIWAVDLAPIRPGEFVSLPSIGVFLPADDSLPDPAHPVRWAPTIEEVVAMPDGTLVTFDGNYGLYTLRFHADDPAPPPAPWPIGRPG